jgi:hypothetical protein
MIAGGGRSRNARRELVTGIAAGLNPRRENTIITGSWCRVVLTADGPKVRYDSDPSAPWYMWILIAREAAMLAVMVRSKGV